MQEMKQDGWVNIHTGLNMQGRDKATAAVPEPKQLSQIDLENLYRADDIAQKIVDRVPYEMFRTGYEVLVEGDDDAGKEILRYLRKLNFDEKAKDAIRLARLYGGAALVLGIDDGRDSSMPVDMDNIRTIKWIAVLDRWQLQYREIQKDLWADDYGLPTLYSINSIHGSLETNQTLIHSSRIIRFDGVRIPERAFMQNSYWSDSVLTAVWNPLRNYSAATDSVGHLMTDFNQSVIALANLQDLIANGHWELVMKRLQLVDMTRSVVRAVVIQEGESYRRETTNLTGVSDTVKILANRLVAASNMPHTIILGEGSQGSTSGRSEEIDFYNLVAQQQESDLKPRQMRLIELLCAAQDGPDVDLEEVTIHYKPLWEMDALQQSQVYKTNAEADTLYITNGVVDPDEVAKSRFSDPEADLTIDLESREAMELQETGEAEFSPQLSSAPSADAVADTALNGAQVTSLLDVVSRVTLGEIPAQSATAILRAAFPAIRPEVIDAIMKPLKVKEPQNENPGNNPAAESQSAQRAPKASGSANSTETEAANGA